MNSVSEIALCKISVQIMKGCGETHPEGMAGCHVSSFDSCCSNKNTQVLGDLAVCFVDWVLGLSLKLSRAPLFTHWSKNG